MPTDFRDMAARAKAAHEAKQAGARSTQNEARDARAKYVDAATAILADVVMPLLERAKIDFAAENIDAKIETDFDVKNRSNKDPSVSFQFCGPRRQSDSFQFKCITAFFSSDGKKITASVAKNPLDARPGVSLGEAEPRQAETMISNAIERCLGSYYDVLQKHIDSGTHDR